MKAIIEKGYASGTVSAPPSKSMAHRLLICAALSKGTSIISNISLSEDIKATIDCLTALGANISVNTDKATVTGIDFNIKRDFETLFCNESGSTLRFLIPLCSLFSKPITLNGTKRLLGRSVEIYEELFAAQGIPLVKHTNGITVNGKLTAGKYTVRGDVSSQFISGLMFALPLLENDSIIEISGDFESASYVLLTLKALADFGVRISKTDEKTYYIKGNQTYKSRKIAVEGDYSNAAFLDVFNLSEGNVFVEGLSRKSVQGDRVYKKYFSRLNSARPTIDITDCPDLAPILMAVAAAKNGVKLTGTHRLKIKESDRGAVMAQELSKFGIKTECFDNEIIVNKGTLCVPSIPLNSHNDHRIVMSLVWLLTLTGGEIIGIEAVNKSYPDYFEDIKNLGIKFKVKKV